ncbi:MAG: OmpH family outer membrane protein [Planctomycetes bacterium]|nr:OmpH family outer membrane protein [Planctomycetota bacterium]MCB9824894.1 OmpH family outer membrane protein [Planctomycetota bacterium]MCB9830319.1 OmpH family outer membrane protein [Planctomycetota bacterium]MCB9902163.1 OmpH family outer membrane protein [Planctomycetota bacterium]
MSSILRLRTAFLGLALVATLVGGRVAWAGPEVAVVDVTRLLNEHPESKELDKRLRRAQEDAQANADQQRERMEALKQEIQKLQAEDPERVIKERNLGVMQMNAEFSYKWAQQQALREYAASLETLYASVVTQVSRYARENGIKVVLQRRADEPKATTPDDFFLRQRLRVVVFADASTDITEPVLARIKALGAQPGSGDQPPPPAGGN